MKSVGLFFPTHNDGTAVAPARRAKAVPVFRLGGHLSPESQRRHAPDTRNAAPHCDANRPCQGASSLNYRTLPMILCSTLLAAARGRKLLLAPVACDPCPYVTKSVVSGPAPLPSASAPTSRLPPVRPPCHDTRCCALCCGASWPSLGASR
jgi:hypothetical protein